MAVSGPTTTPVKLVALGGLGEIGLNLMVLECGGEALVIDAGVMFPEERGLGIDLLIPEFAHLARNGRKLAGVILTHAHEDHIGALPFLMRRFPAPVYGSELTVAFARQRMHDRGVAFDDFHVLDPRQRLVLGPFTIEPISVTHSTPDSLGFAIDTPAGLIVHTGDFKIDDAPVDGERFNRTRFAELGQRGVAILLSDSTNVEREGRTASESSLKPVLNEILARARGRLFLSAFSSHIHRIRQVAEISHSLGRRVVPLGRRILDSVRVGIELGHLRFPPGTFIDQSEAEFYDPNRLTFVASGSQGEPLSALAKIAVEAHPRVRVESGDTVVLSSRSIPGNERTINRMINHLCKRGAEVLYEGVAQVHVSGHASRDELVEMIKLTRPRYFVPIHGEFRHLSHHVALAVEAGVAERNCFLLEDGETLLLDGEGALRDAPTEAGRVMIDGTEPEEFGVLRERQALAREGTVVAVVAITRGSGEIVGGPDLLSHGFVGGNGTSVHMRRAREELRRYLETSRSRIDSSDERFKQELIRVLKSYFSDELGRRPIILPCVVEI